jgi:hypothetical protein
MTKVPETGDKASAEDIVPDLESSKVDVVTSRRQFNRKSIVGSAVLFSLANRPAWGQVPECISDGLFQSLDGAAGGMVSHHSELNADDYPFENPDGTHCTTDGS